MREKLRPAVDTMTAVNSIAVLESKIIAIPDTDNNISGNPISNSDNLLFDSTSSYNDIYRNFTNNSMSYQLVAQS